MLYVIRLFTNILRFTLILFLLKSFLKKNTDIVSYYRAFLEYYNLSDGVLGKIVAILFLTIEMFVIVNLVAGNFVISCLFGIILQFISLIKIIKAYGENMKNNCNCFTFSMPKVLNFKSLCVNMMFIYLYGSIIILQIV